MPDVFVCGENLITSLGFTIEEHLQKIKEDISGVTLVNDKVLYPEDFYASLVDTERLENDFSALADPKKFTRFEKLMILSASTALKSNPGIGAASPKTLFVLSTTKGNIDLLEEKKRDIFESERIHLWKAAEIIATFFNNPNTPVVVSNACISGVLAISNAANILKNSDYENIIVIGGDIASEFVVSGFLSFKSLSFGICKPFDINRDGLNLGEGAGTLILTKGIEKTGNGIRVKVLGGACNNDANHISGPSRTGEGLMLAVTRAIKNSGLTVDQIDFISAHGTATPYNDEMESKAFSSAGMSDTPVNSLKAYFGHTLGGAGTIESVIAIHGMRQNLLFNTLGFKEYGLPEKINVIGRLTEKEQKYILKTASGFGGCNAAVVFAKE